MAVSNLGRGAITMLLIGDSISQGVPGDHTWRYRLWRHLTQAGVEVGFVGPNTAPHGAEVAAIEAGDGGYADGAFDQAHACHWGLTYSIAKAQVRELAAAYGPDFVLAQLGVNDALWHGMDSGSFESNVHEFITEARGGAPRCAILLGAVLDTARAHEDAELSALVSQYNEALRAACAALSTEASPIAMVEADPEFLASSHTRDGVHLNRSGEVTVAAAFADTLAQRFGVGRLYPRAVAA